MAENGDRVLGPAKALHGGGGIEHDGGTGDSLAHVVLTDKGEGLDVAR